MLFVGPAAGERGHKLDIQLGLLSSEGGLGSFLSLLKKRQEGSQENTLEEEAEDHSQAQNILKDLNTTLE